MRRHAFLALAALAFPTSAAHAAPDTPPEAVADATEPCSLADCVALALSRGPDLALAEANREAALAQRSSARARYLPQLKVNGGVQLWDSELTASFDPGIPGINIEPMVVRQQLTWSLNVTLAQPLTDLWQVSVGDALTSAGVDVATLERDAARLDKATTVAEAWLQNALAQEFVIVRKTSITQRTSDRDRAQALVRAGVILQADLLRAELGVQEARQSLAQAERQLALTRARLSQLVGAPRIARPASTPSTHAPLAASLTAAKAEATQKRIEIQRVRTQVRQADASVDLAWSKLAPSVALVGQAQFSRPSTFSGGTMAFVGLTLDWTVWDWGATSEGIDEARARVRAAKAGLQQLEEGIALEVEAAWIDVAAAEDQGALAAQAATIAEDHYALTQKRFDAKAATSFDLVEAESALTKARLDARLAHINGLIARARLARALGRTETDIAREATP